MPNPIDLTGMKFGKLTVVKRVDNDKDGSAMWLSSCECGGSKISTGHSLRRGHVLSCGCIKREKRNSGERDLIGKRFGRLVVLEFIAHDKHHHSMWKCKCDCGAIKDISRLSLVKGTCQSCGCYQRERATESNFIDLSGRKFNRLTVVKYVGRNKTGRSVWECLCDCGNITNVVSSSLINGGTKSCGCYIKEVAGNRLRTHGLSGTLEYDRMCANKRRERKLKLDSEWTEVMEIELQKMFDKCVVCGSSYKMETDHVRPLSLGFGLVPGNAVRLCKKCNSSKHNKDLKDLPDHIKIPIIESAEKFRVYWNGIAG